MREDKYITKAATVANGFLFAQAVFCLGVLLYYLYYYSWTRERYFSNSAGPILYYVLPVVLASLSITALRLRPSYRVNLSLLLASINVSIYAAELLLAVSSSAPLEEALRVKVIAAKERGVEFDTRSRLDVVADLQKRGISASPVLWPTALLKQHASGVLKSDITVNNTEILPLVGLSRKVTVLCNESGEYAIYQSDEHGFNNPQGLWNARPIDIVALGDSFTIGACVPSDKNFVALMRRRWPATLNLGSYGIGPLIEFAIFREYVQFIKPKVVLWFYYEENGLEDLRIEKDSPLLMHYLESNFTQGLLTRQTDIDQALTAYLDTVKNANRPSSTNIILRSATDILKLNRLRQYLALSYGRTTAHQSGGSVAQRGSSEAEMDLFRTILLKVQASCATWGGQLYFVYLPQWQRYARSALTSSNRARVLTSVGRIGLPVIDIHLTFQAQNDALALFPFQLGGSHYNELGHQLIAERVLQSLPLAADLVHRIPDVSHTNGGHTAPLASKPEVLRPGNSASH
jgi:hypothetical protein